LSRTLINK